jgi:hypothetical protein
MATSLPNVLIARERGLAEIQNRMAMSNEHFYIENGNTEEYEGNFDTVQLRSDGVEFEILKGISKGSTTEIDLLAQYNLTGVVLNGIANLEPPIVSPVKFTRVKLISGAVRLNR